MKAKLRFKDMTVGPLKRERPSTTPVPVEMLRQDGDLEGLPLPRVQSRKSLKEVEKMPKA
jgi:hypothetical protein